MKKSGINIFIICRKNQKNNMNMSRYCIHDISSFENFLIQANHTNVAVKNMTKYQNQYLIPIIILLIPVHCKNDIKMLNKIKIMNVIQTFFHFLKYNQSCSLWAIVTIHMNNIHKASLKNDIYVCEFHQSIPYHNIVIMMWYDAISTKKFLKKYFMNFCMKVCWKIVNFQ